MKWDNMLTGSELCNLLMQAKAQSYLITHICIVLLANVCMHTLVYCVYIHTLVYCVYIHTLVYCVYIHTLVYCVYRPRSASPDGTGQSVDRHVRGGGKSRWTGWGHGWKDLRHV